MLTLILPSSVPRHPPPSPRKHPPVTIVVSDYSGVIPSLVPGVDLNSFLFTVRAFVVPFASPEAHSSPVSYHSVSYPAAADIFSLRLRDPLFFIGTMITSQPPRVAKRRSQKAIFLRESQTVRDVASCQFSLR